MRLRTASRRSIISEMGRLDTSHDKNGPACSARSASSPIERSQSLNEGPREAGHSLELIEDDVQTLGVRSLAEGAVPFSVR